MADTIMKYQSWDIQLLDIHKMCLFKIIKVTSDT